MGFGALFLGIMFLYDFPITLGKEGAAYMTLDIFPDLAGWILLFFGVRSLAKHAKGVDRLRFVPVLMMGFALLSLLKDTLWFSSFYTVADNRIQQSLAGVSFDVCNRLFEVTFLVLLFRFSAVFCRKKGEDKLSVSHRTVPGIAIVEGVLFALSHIGLLLPLDGKLKETFNVLSQLDNLFMVFLVWYAAIAMARALIRVRD